jgi:hypothetical protein
MNRAGELTPEGDFPSLKSGSLLPENKLIGLTTANFHWVKSKPIEARPYFKFNHNVRLLPLSHVL